MSVFKNNNFVSHNHEYKEVLDVRDIFMSQWQGKKCVSHDFVITYMAVESFYNGDTYGKELYSKLYNSLGAQIYTPDMFELLLLSYEKFRYSEEPIIKVDENVKIHQGLNRLAMALYHKDYKLVCKIVSPIEGRICDSVWLFQQGYNTQEVCDIEEKSLELRSFCYTPFIGILWPPVETYFARITDLLKKFVDIVEIYDLNFSEQAFQAMIKVAYAIDDSLPNMIEKKILSMEQSHKRIRILVIDMPNPNYRFKYVSIPEYGWLGRKSVSQTVEKTKALVRKIYQNKISYYFDNIMHMGDNYYQNTFLIEFFSFVRYFDKWELKVIISELVFDLKLDSQSIFFGSNWNEEYIVGEELYLKVSDSCDEINIIIRIVILYIKKVDEKLKLDIIKRKLETLIRISLNGYTLLRLRVEVINEDEYFKKMF